MYLITIVVFMDFIDVYQNQTEIKNVNGICVVGDLLPLLRCIRWSMVFY